MKSIRIVVVVACVLLMQGCATQPLEKWHTVRLGEEYRVSRADSVRTFEDYLKLEERLFAELDAEVYERAATGPADALLRYTRGSASDPQVREPNWNRSFEFQVDRPVGAVLLLHGMSDSPYSLRALGEALHRHGYWVVGLRLPGHGTIPAGLLDVRWEDMAGAVRLGVGHLAQRVPGAPLHLVGYSLGAPLALDFTLDAIGGEVGPVPASLVLVSPAIGISRAAAAASWKRRSSYVPGLRRLAWLNLEPEFDPYKYNSFTTNAGEQVHRLTRDVSRRVAALARAGQAGTLPPILAFKSNADATVDTGAVAGQLLERLDPGRHELVLFDVNRMAAKSLLLVTDRNALDLRAIGNDRLPFAVTLVTNANAETADVVARRQEPYASAVARVDDLHAAWPAGVISLSHVALPIPPDDPLYGVRPPENSEVLFLGQMSVLGERGTLRLSSDWLLRLRHNPFYDFLESRTLAWIEDAGRGGSSPPGAAAPVATGAATGH
jgi:alpha-beta hydrolase superfamily lysophospholipase